VLITVRTVAIAVAAGSLAFGVGGCAQFSKALGQQWIEVTFAPNTSVATAKHVTSVCSHVPNLRLYGPVKPTTAQAGVVGSVRYNATHASVAQVADLEQCLGKFPKTVQGFTEMDDSDN
jgi:hypothetical protein